MQHIQSSRHFVRGLHLSLLSILDSTQIETGNLVPLKIHKYTEILITAEMYLRIQQHLPFPQLLRLRQLSKGL